MSAIARTFLLLIEAWPHYLWCLASAPALLAVGLRFNSRLQALDYGWLEWSPFHVKANVTLLPLKLRQRWLWMPYALALAFVMPFLALIEEWVFRYGTTNWVRGLLWGTLAFGVLHLASLVSVRMAIYLSLVGALLVQVYMAAGLLAVFVLHATYNLTALAFLATRREQIT